MKVMNKPLVDALSKVCGGTPAIGAAGVAAAWSVPAEAATGFDVAREYVGPGSRSRLRRAMVERGGWGEVLGCDCPVCGDERGRLCVSHASLCRVKLKSGEAEFGLNAHCFNESCESTRREEFRRKVLFALRDLLGSPLPYLDGASAEISTDGYGSQSGERRRRVEAAPHVPRPAWPIVSPDAPPAAVAYLESRGYDPEWLYANFKVLASREGSAYKLGEEVKSLWDTRVIAPIYQSGGLVGWQGRAVAQSRQKYIFPIGCAKSNWLYNKDFAKFRSAVMVTEGVTNVWSFASVCDEDAESSVATFGKKLSDTQLLSMKRLWGWDGAGVLCLDPDAANHVPGTVDRMLAMGCFGKGLSVMLLDDGCDPASMVSSGKGGELMEMFRKAVASASHDRAEILEKHAERIARAASKAAAPKSAGMFGGIL